MKILKLLSSTIFSGALLLAAGCSKSSEKPIRIAYLPITHALVLQQLADDSGGKVELIRYGSWPELLDALNTGRADAASVLIEPAMKAREQGIGLTALALGHRDGNVIVAANRINSAADLRGRTVAIPHRTSSHHILLRELLEREGIAGSEVTVVEMPPPEMPSALASGRIAAYCVAEPFGALAVRNNLGKVLRRSEELWPDSICCALVANNQFLAKRPESAAALRRDYAAAGAKLHDRAAALQCAGKMLKTPNEVLKLSLEWISFDHLELTESAYQALCEKMIRHGISAKPVKFAEFVIQK